jgi:hypothetical protein
MVLSRWRRQRLLASALGVGLLLVVPALARATADIEVQFNSFPSTQGWTYFSNGVAAPETPTWSLNAGVLAYNTMAYNVGTSGQGTTSFYRQAGLITTTEPIMIEMRGRILENETDGSQFSAGGFSFGFGTGTTGWYMGIMPTQIRNIANEVLSSAYDNTQFHNYRLEWSPGPALRYYVDNTLISTDNSGFAGTPNQVYFGDGTGAANARAEITYFRFRQGSQVTSANSATWGRIKSLYHDVVK